MYHFSINGIDVTCETAEELHAIAFASFNQTTSSVTNFEPLHKAIDEHHEQNGHHKRAPRPEVAAAWAEARRVHKRRGLTVREAFSQIIKEKK